MFAESAKTVLDGFSGTTRVSQAFAKMGYRVFCNDIAAWSEVFGGCYLLNRKCKADYVELIEHLNTLSPKEGLVHSALWRKPDGGANGRAQETVADP